MKRKANGRSGKRMYRAAAGRVVGLEALEQRVLLSTITLAVTNPASFPLRTNNTTPTISGTVSDDAATVTVTVTPTGGTTLGTFDATTDGAGNWSFTEPTALADGQYDLTIDASDNGGADTGELAEPGALTIDTTAVATINTLGFNVSAPTLTGTLQSDVTALSLTVNGSTYTSAASQIVISGTTWSLVLPTTSDGTYPLSLTATDNLGNVTTTDSNLVIDTTAPVVTVNTLATADTTPALSGTVNDPTATISVTVNSSSYAATNNGDGTWTLAEGTISPALTTGVYTVTATATDTLGNVGTSTSTNQLSITTTTSVVVGSDVRTVTYTDSDGTNVTVTAGTGNILLTFTGASVAITGTGSSRAVTAGSGVSEVDVAVQGDSDSLTFTTDNGGDGQTAIGAITGSGNLGSLRATTGNLTGGISMTGVIGDIRLHSIQSDVTMGALAGGVLIMADTVENANISTADIRFLLVRDGFTASNVTADQIEFSFINAVTPTNDGTSFGIHADVGFMITTVLTRPQPVVVLDTPDWGNGPSPTFDFDDFVVNGTPV